ncbi:MAG TPA: hypothetical protein VGU46_00880 [Acidobacteriaceae bacterium]|nr:hypothetical protein [Acidobacteriaceae bacterium]
MKYLFVVVMACFPFSAALILATQPATRPMPQTRAERKVELSELRLERQEMEAKIVLLEAQDHNFLPR